MALPGTDGVPALALDTVTKRFDGLTAVDDVTLRVQAGEFLAIIGPSGSGKTTLMRLIGGFEAPDHGTVSIGGHDVTALPAERRDVSTVFQSYALFPHMSVLDNLMFGPRVHGVPRAARRARADRLLDLVRLRDVARSRPHQLSGGMQQRVALARALANEPSLLLFDEPLGALDRKLREELQAELRRVQRELGATFVYITHDQDEAFGMADRIAVMRDGRILQVGAPAELYDRPLDAWVALFLGDANVIPGRVGRGELTADVGTVRAARVQGVEPGDRGQAIVRPEATRIHPAGPAGPSPANVVRAVVVDVVTLGSRIRITAETPGGLRLHSLTPRSDIARGPHVAVGQDVDVEFDSAAVALYPPDHDRRTPHVAASST
jgi:ABC-type Fe3+/spermidine/putrescine transport system ATPase subunit